MERTRRHLMDILYMEAAANVSETDELGDWEQQETAAASPNGLMPHVDACK